MTYPFDSIQIIVRTDVVFCLTTIPDNIMSRKRHLTSMPSEELPQLLTLVVRNNRLHLMKQNDPALNLDVFP
jgi:hypothetical protein